MLETAQTYQCTATTAQLYNTVVLAHMSDLPLSHQKWHTFGKSIVLYHQAEKDSPVESTIHIDHSMYIHVYSLRLIQVL